MEGAYVSFAIYRGKEVSTGKFAHTVNKIKTNIFPRIFLTKLRTGHLKDLLVYLNHPTVLIKLSDKTERV